MPAPHPPEFRQRAAELAVPDPVGAQLVVRGEVMVPARAECALKVPVDCAPRHASDGGPGRGGTRAGRRHRRGAGTAQPGCVADDFGTTAFAQARIYPQEGCLEEIEVGVGIEVYGANNSGVWKKTSTLNGQQDGCGRYVEVQATSQAGHTAVGMAIVTARGRRVFYSDWFADLPFNAVGPACN